jgi:tRNA(Ile)-lysidine synthase
MSPPLDRDGLPRRRGRSHPPSLRSLAARLIRDESLIARGDVVLCACSGGPDSTALLHVLAMLRPRLGHSLVAHGVDHGLRSGAADELALAGELAGRLGVPFSITRVDVAPGANLQARAREARLAALAAAARAQGARAIATGHTADDRAETFLLRLLRGAGPRGLAVLPPRAQLYTLGGSAGSSPATPPNPRSTLGGSAGSSPATPPNPRSVPCAAGEPTVQVIRPLLLARRDDVLAHLCRHGLGFAQDPSNEDPRFARTRVRRELLPLLEELSPGIVEHLCALADMLGSERAGTGELPDLSVPLGRAQRLAVERARKLGRVVRVRIRGGREIAAGAPRKP